jgi:hypothetical protein
VCAVAFRRNVSANLVGCCVVNVILHLSSMGNNVLLFGKVVEKLFCD